jgi:hypothetical protein
MRAPSCNVYGTLSYSLSETMEQQEVRWDGYKVEMYLIISAAVADAPPRVTTRPA